MYKLLVILFVIFNCFSETDSNNKRDKTKSCKHQRGGIIVSEIGKYIVSLFLDYKGLKLSVLN